MSSGNSYIEGTTVRFSASFKVDDTLTDPTTVTLKVKDEEGNIETFTYPADIVRSGTGAYYKDVVTDNSGRWWYSWIGTGEAEGLSQTSIRVIESEFD